MKKSSLGIESLKLTRAVGLMIVLILFSALQVFSQDYYEFRKQEQEHKGFSILPFGAITVKSGGGSAFMGILKAEYSFGKYISAGVGYSYLQQPSDNFFSDNYFYPEHNAFLFAGGAYPFDNGWLSAYGSVGLGYVISSPGAVSSYFDLSIGIKAGKIITIRPMLAFIQSWPGAGLGIQFKL